MRGVDDFFVDVILGSDWIGVKLIAVAVFFWRFEGSMTRLSGLW